MSRAQVQKRAVRAVIFLTGKENSKIWNAFTCSRKERIKKKKNKKKESRVHAGHETHVGGSIYEHDSKEILSYKIFFSTLCTRNSL